MWSLCVHGRSASNQTNTANWGTKPRSLLIVSRPAVNIFAEEEPSSRLSHDGLQNSSSNHPATMSVDSVFIPFRYISSPDLLRTLGNVTNVDLHDVKTVIVITSHFHLTVRGSKLFSLQHMCEQGNVGGSYFQNVNINKWMYCKPVCLHCGWSTDLGKLCNWLQTPLLLDPSG